MTAIKLQYGNTNTFFINGILFDTDMFGMMGAFYKIIKQNGIQTGDIKYVVCSHYHPDHMGLVSELMNQGIKLLIIDNQKDFIHFSDTIFKKQFGEKYTPINERKAVIISTKESRKFLEDLGIGGEIIKTSSHSEDGIALILDDGQCFVGDLEPAGFIEGYENNSALKRDWDNIMRFKPSIVYYGHANEQVFE